MLGGDPAGMASEMLRRKGLNPAEVDKDTYDAAFAEAKKICDEIFQDGLRRGLLAMSYTHAIRLQPALTIDRGTALCGLALLRETIASVARRHGAA